MDASSSSASGKDAIFAELNNELSFWRPQTDKFHFEFLQVCTDGMNKHCNDIQCANIYFVCHGYLCQLNAFHIQIG